MKEKFIAAIKNGKIENIKALLKSNSDVLNLDSSHARLTEDGFNALHIACPSGQLDMVKFIFKNYTQQFFQLAKQEDNNGKTPLHHAIETKQVDIANFLLEKGIKFKSDDSSWEQLGELVGLYRIQSMLDTLLFNNIRKNKYEAILNLIEAGANVEQIDENGASPLHYAAAYVDKAILHYLIQILLRNGNDELATTKDNDDFIPLAYAVKHEKVDNVKLLIDKFEYDAYDLTIEEECSYKNYHYQYTTLLHYAAISDNAKITELLLDISKVNESDSNEMTPLHLAVKYNSLNVIKIFFDLADINLNPIANSECSIIMTIDKNTKLSKYSVVTDVEKNKDKIKNKNEIVSNVEDLTPLHIAVIEGRLEIVKELLRRLTKDQINQKTDLNYDEKNMDEELLPSEIPGFISIMPVKVTALHFAIYCEQWDIIKFMLTNKYRKKVDTLAKDAAGLTPLHYAVITGDIETATLLLKQLDTADHFDSFGYTPLYYAVIHNRPELVRVILKKSSDKLERTYENYHRGTLLHIACKKKYTEVAIELIKNANSNLNVLDADSYAPLHYAILSNNYKLVKEFREVSEKGIERRVNINQVIMASAEKKLEYEHMKYCRWVVSSISSNKLEQEFMAEAYKDNLEYFDLLPNVSDMHDFSSDLEDEYNNPFSHKKLKNPYEGNAFLHTALTESSPEVLEELLAFPGIDLELFGKNKKRVISQVEILLTKAEKSNLYKLKRSIQLYIRSRLSENQLREALNRYSSVDLKMLIEEKVGNVRLLESLVHFGLAMPTKKNNKSRTKQKRLVTFLDIKEIIQTILNGRNGEENILDCLYTDNIRRYLALKAGYKEQELESTSGGEDSIESEEEPSVNTAPINASSSSESESMEDIQDSGNMSKPAQYVPIFRGINFLLDKFDKDERNEYIRSVEERHTFYSAKAYQLAGYRVGAPNADIQELEKSCEVIQEVIATLDIPENTSVPQWWNAKKKETWQFSNFRFAVQQYYTVNKDGFDQNLLSKIPENQSSIKERLLTKHLRMEEIFDHNPFVSGSILARHAVRYALSESRAEFNIDLSLDPRYEYETGKPKHPVVGIVFVAFYTPEEYYAANRINVPLLHAQGEMHISHELLQETEVTFPAVMRNVLIQQRVTYPSFENEYDSDYASKYGFNEEILTKIKTTNRLKWLKKSYTPKKLYNEFRYLIKSTHRNELERRDCMQRLREFLIEVYDQKLIEKAEKKALELGGELVFELPDATLSHEIYTPFQIKEMAIEEAKKRKITSELSEEDDKDKAVNILEKIASNSDELNKKRKLKSNITEAASEGKKKKTGIYKSNLIFRKLSKFASSPLFFNSTNSKQLSLLKLNLSKDENDRWYDQDKINQLLVHYLAGYSEEVELLDAISGTQLGGETLSINLWDRVMQHVIQETKGNVPKPFILIPLNLHANHWTLLCIHQDPDNLAAPTVIYIDPFGDYPPEAVQTAILENYTEANFKISNIQFQIDEDNCGPWIVAIAKYYAQYHTIPPEDWDIDIEVRREEDEGVLQLTDYAI